MQVPAPDNMKAFPGRRAWVDATKGVVIFLVVVGHAWRGINTAGLLDAAPTGLFYAIDVRIYAFHMPLFFLLSGLFLVPSLIKRSVASYAASRMMRLLYPLILWTYIFAIFKFLAGDMANNPIQRQDIFASPIPGRWQFWFLWALLLLQLSLIPLRPALRSAYWRPRALCGVFLFSILMLFLPVPTTFHAATSNALQFLPFLALGLLVAEFRLLLCSTDRLVGVWLAVFITCLVLVPTLAEIGFPEVFTASILCMSLIGVMAQGTVLFPALTQGLAWLGAYSMIIFLSHTIFSAGTRAVLVAIEVDNITVHIGLATFTGVVMPIALQRTFSRIASPKLLGA